MSAAPEVTGGHAHCGADDPAAEDGYDSHHDRNAGTVDDATYQISPQLVGAQWVSPVAGGFRYHGDAGSGHGLGGPVQQSCGAVPHHTRCVGRHDFGDTAGRVHLEHYRLDFRFAVHPGRREQANPEVSIQRVVGCDQLGKAGRNDEHNHYYRNR